MNLKASSELKSTAELRGIKPELLVRRPRVAIALAVAQAVREGGLKIAYEFRIIRCSKNN